MSFRASLPFHFTCPSQPESRTYQSQAKRSGPKMKKFDRLYPNTKVGTEISRKISFAHYRIIAWYPKLGKIHNPRAIYLSLASLISEKRSTNRLLPYFLLAT
jgi:hypothetical protein